MVASFIEGFKIVVGKFSRIDVKVRFEKWLEITLLWTTSATKWPFPNQSENSNESYHIYQLVQRIQEQPILKVRILIIFLQKFFVVFDLVKTCFFYGIFWNRRKFRNLLLRISDQAENQTIKKTRLVKFVLNMVRFFIISEFVVVVKVLLTMYHLIFGKNSLHSTKSDPKTCSKWSKQLWKNQIT